MSEAGVQGAKALTGAISEACSEAECIWMLLWALLPSRQRIESSYSWVKSLLWVSGGLAHQHSKAIRCRLRRVSPYLSAALYSLLPFSLLPWPWWQCRLVTVTVMSVLAAPMSLFFCLRGDRSQSFQALPYSPGHGQWPQLQDGRASTGTSLAGGWAYGPYHYECPG